MSDTLNQFAATAESDIDVDALMENLADLKRDELVNAITELDIPGFDEKMKPATLRKLIRDFVGVDKDGREMPEEKKTPKPDFDFGAAATPAPLVEDVDAEIKVIKKMYWVNPFTGNRVVHNQADVDGRVNMDGFAVVVAAANPADAQIEEEEIEEL